jgi:type I restriction enzyme S subunit
MLSTDGEKGALEKNDILIVEGNGSQDHIGRAAIWDGSLPNARHQNHLIRLRPWTISPNHILSWLQSPTCRIFLIEKATSMSGLYNLSLSKVASIVIPIMPYNEGIFISNLIDNMICLINDSYTKLETAQSDIEKLEQSIFGKAFRGEL